ncbi:MAG: hypothetical protein ACE37K_21255 [Planctomycetota bacterium]
MNIRSIPFFSILAAAATLAAQSPTNGDATTNAQAVATDLRVPIHGADPDPVGGDYGIWAAGPDYKVSFHDGMTFVPVLGASAPHNETLHWRTTSVRVGERELVQQLPEPHQVGDFRYEYHFGTVVEAYDVRTDGLEQTFVFSQRPNASGDLVIDGAVTGTTTSARRGAAHAPLAFVDANGREVVRYGVAIAIDAYGRRFPMTTSLRDGTVRLRLGAADVDRAAFPLVVDPLLGNSLLDTGNEVEHVDLFVDAEQSSSNVWLVFSRASSATDRDLIVTRNQASLSGPNAVVFSDLQSTWSATEGQLAGTGGSGAGKVVAAFTREFPVSNTRRVRWHTHAKSSASFNTNYGSAPYASATHQWRPDVGGSRAMSIGNHVLIVYQRESNPFFANVADSEIVGFRVDVSSGLNGAVDGSTFVIGNSSVVTDKEHPSVNQAAEGGIEYSWVVAWQLHGNASSSTWNVLAQRVQATFGNLGNVRSIATGSEHELSPKVAGADGRYLVSYARRDNTANKPLNIQGDEVVARRLDWEHSAQNGTLPHPAQVLATTPLFTMQVADCAFDLDSGSHWSVLTSDYGAGTVQASKLGYDGMVSEQNTAWAVAGSTPEDGGICYDPVSNRFALAFGVDNGSATQPIWATWQNYVALTPPTLLGSNCANANVSHQGTQHIGSEWETFRVDTALPGRFVIFGASLAPANAPLDSLGMTGCVLSVDPTAPNLLGTVLMYADNVGDAEITLAIPSAMGPFELFTQWFVLETGANPAGILATHGLRTPFGK